MFRNGELSSKKQFIKHASNLIQCQKIAAYTRNHALKFQISSNSELYLLQFLIRSDWLF